MHADVLVPAADDARWSAVCARDRACDGKFVFAVTSTGIYCRPSCGARRPHRRNVRFFADAREAAAAGFRACRRCDPDAVAQVERERGVPVALCRLLARQEGVPTQAALGAAVGLPPGRAVRLFREALGMTPQQYARGLRQARLRATLGRADSVTTAVYEAGFSSTGRFYEAAEGALGMTPSAFRAGGAGEAITVALSPTDLGLALVGMTARGVCAVLLGDEAEALRADLRRRFPRATLRDAQPPAPALVTQVLDLIAAPLRAAALPLDLRGTAFQLAVWQALRAIPPGQTTSYAELAARVGAPRAVRAVAQACGANPVAVAVPCHRVLRSDGDLSGYRWGVARKRALLEREGVSTAPARRSRRP